MCNENDHIRCAIRAQVQVVFLPHGLFVLFVKYDDDCHYVGHDPKCAQNRTKNNENELKN